MKTYKNLILTIMVLAFCTLAANAQTKNYIVGTFSIDNGNTSMKFDDNKLRSAVVEIQRLNGTSNGARNNPEIQRLATVIQQNFRSTSKLQTVKPATSMGRSFNARKSVSNKTGKLNFGFIIDGNRRVWTFSFTFDNGNVNVGVNPGPLKPGACPRVIHPKKIGTNAGIPVCKALVPLKIKGSKCTKKGGTIWKGNCIFNKTNYFHARPLK